MKTDKYPQVSIISVNYNQLKATCDFLDSVRKISYPNTEIILVDNNSKEDPGPVIEEKYPEVKLIKSAENLGFAGGNNLGIRAAKGKYFMMLNNDTEVEPGFLEPLVEAMENDPQTGMTGSKVKFFDQPDTIQFAGATPMTRFTATSHFIGFQEKDMGQYDEQKNTPYIIGAAMMTSREVCQKAGLMADFFFLYYEELDWQERIKKAGYKLSYVPDSVVYHKESLSVGKESPLQAYWITRNRLLLIRRNSTSTEVLISFIYLSFVALPYRMLKYILKRNWRSLKAVIVAMAWHYYHLFDKKKIMQNDHL